MNEINPEQLLSQIRSMGSALQSEAAGNSARTTGGEFGSLLKSTIEAVNETQQQASSMKVAFSNGSSDASLAEVMIAAQKADLSFRAMTEVRNKLVTAYQEIMNMPV